MENVDPALISNNEPWVDLYRDCFNNPQNMKKKILIMYKRKSEIVDAIKNLSVDEMLSSIRNNEFLMKPEGTKIAANFYFCIGPMLFRREFSEAILKLKNDSHYDRYATLLINTFGFVKSTVDSCSPEEQEREIDSFIALVASKIFEIAVFCEDNSIQKKFMNLFKAICEKSREVSKSSNNAIKSNIVNNAQLLMFKGTIEFLWLDYSLRHKMDRLNTAIMMTHMFPVNPKLKIHQPEEESCFMLQVTTLKRLILDPFVPIRAFLAKEFLGILGRGWFQLDNTDLREIISLFVDRLANESVPLVRAKVYEGLKSLCDYPFTGSCLAKLGKIKAPLILRDIDRSVRLAGLNWLNTMVTNKILAHSMIDIKDFVMALELEKDMSVARKIIHILVGPFFEAFINPDSCTGNYLDMFRENFTHSRYANYIFHKWIQIDNLLNINAIVKHMRNLIIYSISLLRKNLNEQSSLSGLTPYEVSQLKSQHLENVEVVKSFIEAAGTLYCKGRKELLKLKKDKAVQIIDEHIMKLYSIVKDHYGDNKIYQVTLTLVDYIGNNVAIDEVNKMLHTIRTFTAPEDVVIEYLTKCLDHKPMDVMEVILNGTEIIRHENKIKNPNELKYFGKTMDYCSKLMYSAKVRVLIMNDWSFYVQRWSDNLDRILQMLESRCQLSDGETFTFGDDLLLHSLKIKFILMVLLDNRQDSINGAASEKPSDLVNYSAWEFFAKFNSLIKKYYKNTNFSLENDGLFKERIFQFGIETFKELCTCYEFNISCVEQTSAWLNTIYNVNAPQTILVSLLKIYPDIIEAMYHGPDLYDSIRNVLHRFLVDVKEWILECSNKEIESSQKFCVEITRLWKNINNKFHSLVFLNISAPELAF
uniref:Condensin complex subunit 1 n=1 Tax=Strongyloides venezuelensis TaxID=75913 RepID=A0A0K0FMT4_STRVS